MMNSSAQESGGAMGFGVWLTVACTLSVAKKRILRVNSCGSKRSLEGIWTDVSCIFDCTLALVSISENCISNLEHVDWSPFDKLLGSGKRLVISTRRFASLRCLVSLPFRADGIDILVREVF